MSNFLTIVIFILVAVLFLLLYIMHLGIEYLKNKNETLMKELVEREKELDKAKTELTVLRVRIKFFSSEIVQATEKVINGSN